MMNRIVPAIAALALTGCATTPTEWPSNLEYSESQGYGYAGNLTAAHYAYPATTGFDDLAICVVGITDTTGVVIRDSARSWIGPYTGNYYHHGDATATTGGAGVKHAGDQGMVISGSIKYSANISNYSLLYDATIGIEHGKVQVTFSNIRRAMLYTGSLANDGYQPVPMRKRSGIYKVTEQLERQAMAIRECANS